MLRARPPAHLYTTATTTAHRFRISLRESHLMRLFSPHLLADSCEKVGCAGRPTSRAPRRIGRDSAARADPARPGARRARATLFPPPSDADDASLLRTPPPSLFSCNLLAGTPRISSNVSAFKALVTVSSEASLLMLPQCLARLTPKPRPPLLRASLSLPSNLSPPAPQPFAASMPSVVAQITQIPVGRSIPDILPHAISVSLPLWKDNVAYEEGQLGDVMINGYPRFFVHLSIQKVRSSCLRAARTVREVGLQLTASVLPLVVAAAAATHHHHPSSLRSARRSSASRTSSRSCCRRGPRPSSAGRSCSRTRRRRSSRASSTLPSARRPSARRRRPRPRRPSAQT